MKERVRLLRKTLGLTQQAFADHLGIRQNTIAKYETGKSVPTTAVIALICREFHVSENWLRFGSGDMFLSLNDAVLESFCNEFHASSVEKQLLKLYFQVDESVRSAFVDQILRRCEVS